MSWTDEPDTLYSGRCCVLCLADLPSTTASDEALCLACSSRPREEDASHSIGDDA